MPTRLQDAIRISIHALREEGDQGRVGVVDGFDGFLSTPSARRATSNLSTDFSSYVISIHALREEGDVLLGQGCANLNHFYPRPPRGGRHDN